MDKKKILIVEDDQSLRELYTDLLTAQGYSVENAEDGDKGLEKIKMGGWDLVLMDIVLPGVNGLEIIRKLSQEQGGTIAFAKKIVFLTNMYTEAQGKEALSLGQGYLVKVQLTPDVFLSEVKKYLD